MSPSFRTLALSSLLLVGCGPQVEGEDPSPTDTDAVEQDLATFPAPTPEGSIGFETKSGGTAASAVRSDGFHAYYFQGTAGDKVTFAAASPQFQVFLRIHPPTGNNTNVTGSVGSVSTASRTKTLTATGTYVLIVTSAANAANGKSNTTGGFNLSVTRAALAPGRSGITKVSPYDPARLSLPYECTGPTLTMPEALRLFDAANDAISFAGLESFRDARQLGAIPVTNYNRHCHPITGCGPLTQTESIDGMDGELFALPSPGGAYLSAVFSSGNDVMMSPDALVHTGYDLGKQAQRLRFSRTPSGQVCIELISQTVTYVDESGTDISFSVGKKLVTLGVAPGSLVSDAPPQPAPAVLCPGATATPAQMVGWFAPGTDSTQLTGQMAVQSAERKCDAVVGCTGWSLSSPGLGAPDEPSELSVSPDGKFSWSSYRAGVLPIVNGLVNQTVGDDLKKTTTVGRVTASCVELKATYETHFSTHKTQITWSARLK